MSRDPQPWWASAAGVDGLDEVDPVEAFRAARRPPGADGTAEDDPATAPPGADAPSGDPATGGHRPELCGICPLCSLARSIEETRPELVEHLTEAARHLAAAARSLMEHPPQHRPGAASEGRRSQDGPAARPSGAGVERIVLDDASADGPPRPPTDTTGERGSS